MNFSVITPTLQRNNLIRCCKSVDAQTHTGWEHIVVVDGGPLRADLLNSIGGSKRTVICLGECRRNFGNTPRHIGWKLAEGDYSIYLDDDNYFAHDEALADIARSLDEARPDWAVFPILRFGDRFFSGDPRCCHVDTANMVIRRVIAQWPNRDEYTVDGIFCEELRAKYSYVAFPEISPIIVVPVQGKGRMNISQALATQGWMSEEELLWLAEAASSSQTIVEIGVYKGRSTCAIAGNTTGTVYSVDIWSECGADGWYYDLFRSNTAHLSNVIPINRASVYAAREFAAEGRRFDMIFIDAAHDEYNVRQDIMAWRPLLADGGTFCGHDYGFAGWPDVKRIVDELVSDVKVVDTIWVAG